MTGATPARTARTGARAAMPLRSPRPTSSLGRAALSKRCTHCYCKALPISAGPTALTTAFWAPSREILRGTRLPPQGRASLRAIVAAVEWTYFGGYPAALADYNACRRSFEDLRQALASNPT